MIRSCTWLLIVLVALPFTAPFATCDLNTLLGRNSPIALALSVSSPTDIAACSETCDAASLSPKVDGIVLSRDGALAQLVAPGSDRRALTRWPYSQLAQQGSPVQLSVLRL